MRKQYRRPTLRDSKLFLNLTEEGLRRGHTVRFRACGSSMGETIRDGEWILVEPVAPQRVREGDVVLASLGQALVAHRVVAIRLRCALPGGAFAADFTLQGDARGSGLDCVDGQHILGRVLSVNRTGHKRPLDIGRALRAAIGPRVGLMVSLLLASAFLATLMAAQPLLRSRTISVAAVR